MKEENTNRKFLLVFFVAIVSAIVTVTITVGAAYLLGYHRPHSVTVTDETTGEQKTLWTCGMHPWIIQEEPGNCPICAMKLTPKRDALETSRADAPSEKNIAYWRAPMNPMEIYDKPGKSAMGMDLVPVYENELIGGVAVSIDPVTQQNMGIRTAKVEKIPLTRTIRTYGHVTYDETRTAQINTKVSGWIEKIHADFTGKLLEKGEPLFDIYSPELVSAQEEYLAAFGSARRRLGEATRTRLLSSARRRLEYFDMPKREIRRIEKSGQVRKTLTIRSPFRGVVTMKNAEQGSYVKAGTTTYRIADLSRVWVEVHIYEYELPWVEMGQQAEMTFPYLPGKSFSGKISYIYPYLQAKTRDVVVRLEFDNPDLSLKPDMYADVRIRTSNKGDGLAIPSEAVIRSGERNVVFVQRENNKFTPRDVSLGLSMDGRMVQVLTGLAPGEIIVTSGQFMLDSESKLKEAIAKMMEAKRAKPESVETKDDFFNVSDETEGFFNDMEKE
ncbi:MAG: efflux RND transporter periplasmic adaptor subunit [Deltaproteobacteria bacterium]|nr:efflux RND transporter periplasmic adaptor subunit [Deltaproteobacteria bacterium]